MDAGRRAGAGQSERLAVGLCDREGGEGRGYSRAWSRVESVRLDRCGEEPYRVRVRTGVLVRGRPKCANSTWERRAGK